MKMQIRSIGTMENAYAIIESAKQKLPAASTYPYMRIRIPVYRKIEIDPIPISIAVDLKLDFNVEFQKVVKNGHVLDEWEFVNIY